MQLPSQTRGRLEAIPSMHQADIEMARRRFRTRISPIQDAQCQTEPLIYFSYLALLPNHLVELAWVEAVTQPAIKMPQAWHGYCCTESLQPHLAKSWLYAGTVRELRSKLQVV